MESIPYAAQWINEEDIRAVSQALRSDLITQGPKTVEFEDELARKCGAKYAVAVNSGTSALHIACIAAGVGPGDEVITSPITFVASANCALYCGARPVFADIRSDTVNIDPIEIEKKLTPRTKAVIPVHFAGHPCDMEEIRKRTETKGIAVIEDAAHALGARYKDTTIGSCSFSDMAVLSFHPVKHITTGEGGAVLTNDESLWKKLKLLRSHGITRDTEALGKKEEGAWYYEMQELGFNYRITEFQSALGISQLARLDDFVQRRREISARYNSAFTGIKDLILPAEKDYAFSSWHLYVIRVRSRRDVFDRLRQAGIMVNVHYLPVYLQPYYRGLGYKEGSCPVAEKYYEGAISLPIYYKLSDREMDYVISKVKEVLI